MHRVRNSGSGEPVEQAEHESPYKSSATRKRRESKTGNLGEPAVKIPSEGGRRKVHTETTISPDGVLREGVQAVGKQGLTGPAVRKSLFGATCNKEEGCNDSEGAESNDGGAQGNGAKRDGEKGKGDADQRKREGNNRKAEDKKQGGGNQQGDDSDRSGDKNVTGPRGDADKTQVSRATNDGGTDVFISLNIRGYAGHKMEEMTASGRSKMVTRPGAHSNIEQMVQAEAKKGKRVIAVFLQETWLQTADVPLQLTGYKWFGHCRTVKKTDGRYSGGLGTWVLNEYSASFKPGKGDGNYGKSESVQWLLFERPGTKRAFCNMYKDSKYFVELMGYDGRAIWGGIRDDVAHFKASGYEVVVVGDLNAKLGYLDDGGG